MTISEILLMLQAKDLQEQSAWEKQRWAVWAILQSKSKKKFKAQDLFSLPKDEYQKEKVTQEYIDKKLERFYEIQKSREGKTRKKIRNYEP